MDKPEDSQQQQQQQHHHHQKQPILQNDYRMKRHPELQPFVPYCKDRFATSNAKNRKMTTAKSTMNGSKRSINSAIKIRKTTTETPQQVVEETKQEVKEVTCDLSSTSDWKSLADEVSLSSDRKSLADEEPLSSDRKSLVDEEPPSSDKKNLADEELARIAQQEEEERQKRQNLVDSILSKLNQSS